MPPRVLRPNPVIDEMEGRVRRSREAMIQRRRLTDGFGMECFQRDVVLHREVLEPSVQGFLSYRGGIRGRRRENAFLISGLLA